MTASEEWLTVESLDLEAQGVAHNAEGKVVFIEGALPGEQVQVSVGRRKNNWEQATMTALRRESSQRVTPACRHFGTCGGCKMQHFHVGAQVATKQRALEDALWHLGKTKAERVLRPIEGPAWGYRYRARLSVRHVVKKGKVLVGFHERKSSYVADMDSCEVLPRHLSDLLLPLRELIGSMDQRDRLPQIEVAIGSAVTALVLRHLEPLSQGDLQRLRGFGATHGIQWWLQPKGPDTVHLLDEGGPALDYALPEFGITMPFKPTDFTQVNHQINQVLVSRALRLLDAQAGERVIDWFCGLGNFTLPIATQAREVLGIEGSESLVARSRENAAVNGLGGKTSFVARNLLQDVSPGSKVKCPACAQEWVVPGPAAPPHPQGKPTSNGAVVAILVIAGGLGSLVVIGMLAAIAIPNFIKFGARSKQGEAKSNLKALYIDQKTTFAEHDQFESKASTLGFAPERGNRYAYFIDLHGPMEDRSTSHLAGTEDATSIGADTFKHATAPVTANDLPASVRQIGVTGKCPECSVTMVAAGRITTSGKLDVWSVSTAAREIGGHTVEPGEPYNDVARPRARAGAHPRRAALAAPARARQRHAVRRREQRHGRTRLRATGLLPGGHGRLLVPLALSRFTCRTP